MKAHEINMEDVEVDVEVEKSRDVIKKSGIVGVLRKIGESGLDKSSFQKFVFDAYLPVFGRIVVAPSSATDLIDILATSIEYVQKVRPRVYELEKSLADEFYESSAKLEKTAIAVLQKLADEGSLKKDGKADVQNFLDAAREHFAVFKKLF